MNENKPNQKQFVAARLPSGTIKLLDRCAELTGQSRSDLIRDALGAYLYPLYNRLNDLKKEVN